MPTLNAIALAAINTFTAAARAFADAIQVSTTDSSYSTQALIMLNALPALCATATNAIRMASTDPESGDIVTQCDVLLHICEQLGDFWFANRAPLSSWSVPEDMPLVVISERLYGTDAQNHIDELLANNPNILGMVLVPAGTTLVVNSQTTPST